MEHLGVGGLDSAGCEARQVKLYAAAAQSMPSCGRGDMTGRCACGPGHRVIVLARICDRADSKAVVDHKKRDDVDR